MLCGLLKRIWRKASIKSIIKRTLTTNIQWLNGKMNAFESLYDFPTDFLCCIAVTNGNVIPFAENFVCMCTRGAFYFYFFHACLIVWLSLLKYWWNCDSVPWNVIVTDLMQHTKLMQNVNQTNAQKPQHRWFSQPKTIICTNKIQNTLNVLINWSALLMVSKWFYIEFTAIIFMDYLFWLAWSAAVFRNNLPGWKMNSRFSYIVCMHNQLNSIKINAKFTPKIPLYNIITNWLKVTYIARWPLADAYGIEWFIANGTHHRHTK